MLLGDVLRQTWQSLRTHGFRSLLTLFGVTWGTTSVVVLIGWSQGLRQSLEAGFEKTGRNLAHVKAGPIAADFRPAADRRELWLELEDVELLRQRARRPALLAGERQRWGTVARGGRSISTDIRGVEPEELWLRDATVAAGRSIGRDDLVHRRRVAVLGDEARARLLGAASALDQRIRIDGIPFEVIGVLQPVGTQLSYDGGALDEQIWIPLTTDAMLWSRGRVGGTVVDRILFRVVDRRDYPRAAREVRSILAERLRVAGDDDQAIEIFSTIEILSRLPMGQTRIALLLISAGTLLIGAVGVFALMLDAVHERRSEIGMRLAVGARRRDVTLHFLLETLAITGVGGSIGIFLGAGVCVVLESLRIPDVIPVPRLDWGVVTVAFSLLVLAGGLATAVPAWRAATTDPARVLRLE